MKKLISMILIVCMACMMIPAMAEEDLTGEWYVNTMSEGGVSYDAATLASFGMTMTLTLNADGTATMVSPSETEPIQGTWTNDGGKLALTLMDGSSEQGETTEFTVADGVLTMTIGDSTTMTFTRETAAPAYTPAEKKTDAKLEDYAGKWTFSYIGMQDKIIDVNAFISVFASMMAEGAEVPDLASQMSLEIEGTKIILGRGTENEQNLEATFADGQMTVKQEADGATLEVVISMLQDGVLAMEGFAAAGVSGTVYLTPVTAAEEVPAA